MVTKYFDKSVPKSSPIQKDYNRVVNYDENGNEFITWEEVDYSSIQQANGSVDMWSLNSLLAAGVNPNFPIHTGNNTRLEGLNTLNQAVAIADSILAEETKSEE